MQEQRPACLVVDPVMVATSGASLLQPSAIRALRRDLLPLATLVTPNLDEAAMLLNRR
jgi:hydroxymethylpyrimidine/phosphomethylpyrimidine kinase